MCMSVKMPSRPVFMSRSRMLSPGRKPCHGRHGTACAQLHSRPGLCCRERRGHHQWLIEFASPPADPKSFITLLDRYLRQVNSDYDAKRTGNLFLDPPTMVIVPEGLFDRWLATTGKLGDQRKVPRLCNDRHIVDALLALL